MRLAAAGIDKIEWTGRTRDGDGARKRETHRAGLPLDAGYVRGGAVARGDGGRGDGARARVGGVGDAAWRWQAAVSIKRIG